MTLTATQFIILFFGSLIWLYLASRMISKGFLQSIAEAIIKIIKEVSDRGKER